MCSPAAVGGGRAAGVLCGRCPQAWLSRSTWPEARGARREEPACGLFQGQHLEVAASPWLPPAGPQYVVSAPGHEGGTGQVSVRGGPVSCPERGRRRERSLRGVRQPGGCDQSCPADARLCGRSCAASAAGRGRAPPQRPVSESTPRALTCPRPRAPGRRRSLFLAHHREGTLQNVWTVGSQRRHSLGAAAGPGQAPCQPPRNLASGTISLLLTRPSPPCPAHHQPSWLPPHPVPGDSPAPLPVGTGEGARDPGALPAALSSRPGTCGSQTAVPGRARRAWLPGLWQGDRSRPAMLSSPAPGTSFLPHLWD